MSVRISPAPPDLRPVPARTSFNASPFTRGKGRGNRPQRICIPKAPPAGRREKTPRGPRASLSDDSLAYTEAALSMHPITPRVQATTELAPLVERCANFSSYPIVAVTGGVHAIRPPEAEAIKKGNTLTAILGLVSDPLYRKRMSLSSLIELFQMVNNHIFREIPGFRPSNEFSEISQVYVVKNWEHVKTAHAILREMMADPGSFRQFVTREFTRRLVHQLGSPVTEEQNQIELDIAMILKLYAGRRADVLHWMLEKLIAYLDGVKHISWCVGPILRLFMSYFESLEAIKQSNFLLFRTVFYPLFATDLACFFAYPLHNLSRFFQVREAATALWCLSYLRKHWPLSSTRKQMMFFDEITGLLPALPVTMMEKAGGLIARTMSPCLTADHWQLAMNATSFCSQEEFILCFKPMPDLVDRYLLPASRLASSHWNANQAEYSTALSERLAQFKADSKPATRSIGVRKAPREDHTVVWRRVIEAAASNDPSIDTDLFGRSLCEH